MEVKELIETIGAVIHICNKLRGGCKPEFSIRPYGFTKIKKVVGNEEANIRIKKRW
jgi:hypothetical protein